MACSSSFTGASPSSRASLSPASASASSSYTAPVSFFFHHLQQQLPSLSSSTANKHVFLRWDCEKIIKQASCVVVTFRQGSYETSKKNSSQRGGGGGRNASLALKEEKAGRKGGSSGSRDSKQYKNYSNPRSQSRSSNSTFQNTSPSNRKGESSSNRKGQRLSVIVEEDNEVDYVDDGIVGKSKLQNKSNYNNLNSSSFGARKGIIRSSKFSDEEEEDESEDDLEYDEDAAVASGDEASLEDLIMPIPPAGFVLAEDGSVSIMAPPHKRITTLVDSQTKLPLDCLIRRVFSSSDGRQCFLLCPLDTPLQVLKIEGGEALKELQVSDEEMEDIFPTASYELAKQRLHLVQSGYVY
ncbi:hypothetical protein L7F22_052031 [Adiantum nelumboides]|nr:hypothetical protein [Adiantum nelumboides]